MAELNVLQRPEGEFAAALPTPVPALVAEWASRTPETPHAVEGVKEAVREVAGSMVCHEGRTSGEKCGKVLEVNKEEVIEINGREVRREHLVETDACGEGGDSGGPYFFRTTDRPPRILMMGIHTLGLPEGCPGRVPRTWFEPLVGVRGAERYGILNTFSRQELLTTSNEDRSRSTLNLLPLGTETSPVSFKIASRGSVFNSGTLTEVRCEKDEGTGKFTSKRLGTFRVTFGSDCENALTRGLCRGLSSLPGRIVVEGEFHLRRLLSLEKEHVVVFFLFNHIHFSCGGVLVLVLGCVAGLLLPAANTLTATAEIHTQTSGGRQVISEADTDSETGMETCGPLKQAIEEGREETGTESTEEELSGFEQNSRAVEILVMA